MASSAPLFYFLGALPALFYFLGAGWAPLAPPRLCRQCLFLNMGSVIGYCKILILLQHFGGSGRLILLFGGGLAPLAPPPALPPVLIFKYEISYRLLQNFNSFATFNLSSP